MDIWYNSTKQSQIMSTLYLPPETRSLINHYLALQLGPHKIRCPYFQNVTKKRVSPVFAGKGLPEEIEKEVKNILGQKLLSRVDSNQLRLYLILANLGIDCSGLVTNILDSFLKEKDLGPIEKIIKYPTSNPLRLLVYQYRPRSNIAASTLTHLLNTYSVKNFNQVKIGDLLKIGDHHVALINEVELNQKNQVIRIGYIHSTSDYLEEHGVRQGNIFITNREKPLEKQKWDEEYRDRNWMLEDYLAAPKKQKGFRGLKVLT